MICCDHNLLIIGFIKILPKKFKNYITKRTCHYIIEPRKRRSLYLSLVRSQFEHCSSIWRPITETEVFNFEKLQKKAIKWIFSEQNRHYETDVYLNRCSQCPLSLTLEILFFFIRWSMKAYPYPFPPL